MQFVIDLLDRAICVISSYIVISTDYMNN